MPCADDEIVLLGKFTDKIVSNAEREREEREE